MSDGASELFISSLTRKKSFGSFPQATRRSSDKIWLNFEWKVEATSVNVDSFNAVLGMFGGVLKKDNPKVKFHPTIQMQKKKYIYI